MEKEIKEKFDEWFYGIEGFAQRFERIYEDVENSMNKNPKDFKVVQDWLQWAFKIGHEASQNNLK